MKAQTPHVCSVPDIDAILRDIESPDETVCASAVRLLCPCRFGWEPFKEHLPLIRQLQKVGETRTPTFSALSAMDRLGNSTN